MSARTIGCTKCRASLPLGLANTGALHACPQCGAGIRLEVFPALLEPPQLGTPGERVMVEGEASCFFHPTKKAILPCDSCGRFLCPVCDVEIGDQHLCPACLEAGKKKGKMDQLENRRELYDSRALTLAFLPMLLFWPTIITAPMTLYISIRYWKAPGSIIPRRKWRFVLAILIASGQIFGWAFAIYGVLR